MTSQVMDETANHSAGSIRIFALTVPGYLPPLHNALKGVHWSGVKRERDRALLALRSSLQSIAGDQPIGTGGPSKDFKTALSTLESSKAMIGVNCKAVYAHARLTTNNRKGRRSKL
jgi:hypothetical protein